MVFIFKLSASGDSLIYSSYMGGSGVDDLMDIAVDESSQVYLIGWTDYERHSSVEPIPADNLEFSILAIISS